MCLLKYVRAIKFACILLLLLFSLQSISQTFSTAINQFISVKGDTIALIHAKIFDGTGAPAKNDQTIVIIKGRISNVGDSKKLNYPVRSEQLTAPGRPSFLE